MATSAQRRLAFNKIRRFGSGRVHPDMPDLTEIQTVSYEAFLQYEYKPRKLFFNTMDMEALIREHNVDEQRLSEALVKAPPLRNV